MTDDEDQPVVLVVCDDRSRSSAIGAILRASRIHPARTSSLSGALRLITQIRFNGCILAMSAPAEACRDLSERLEALSPGGLRVCLTEETEGWTHCAEAELDSLLRARFPAAPPEPWSPAP